MMQKIVNSQGEVLDYSFHSANLPTNKDTLVLIGHGLTGDKNRELVVAVAHGLAEKGWNCVRFSYSGNGDSQGSYKDMCISKEVSDLKALIQHFTKDYQKIIYIGHSMGAAVGALVVAEDKLGDIVAMVSLAGMVNTQVFCETEFGNQVPDDSYMWDDANYPLTQTFVDDLTQIRTVLPAVEQVEIPWLMIHGSEDDVVLPVDSEQLYQQLKGAKKHVVIEDADHSFSEHHPQVIAAIQDFLSTQVH